MSSVRKNLKQKQQLSQQKRFTSLHSESESIERYNRGLTERFWRGNEKGLSDLCRLAFSDLPSLIPRCKESAEVGIISVEKIKR
jgi:hypothetical protein